MRFLVPAAYRPLLADGVFRRLSIGFGVSYLGDGMSFVAVAWLALEMAPPQQAAWWVGASVAAYTLPGVVGAAALGRWLRRMPARRLLLADNVLRGAVLGAIPAVWLAGWLTLPAYAALLAASSLLHTWGSAGKYALLAELLPHERRLAANTLVSSLMFVATIAGPAAAGVMVTQVSAAWVLGVDALTYAFLAAVVARLRLPNSPPPVEEGRPRGGLALLRARPQLLGLLVLTWFFNALYGPVEVALPLHVSRDLLGAGSLLGLYWALFGAGATVGALAAGALRRLPLWPATVGIVLAWGALLLPFGFGAPAPVTVACFALGGAVYGPFMALSTTLLQQQAPPRQLASMLAARSAALLTAGPLGVALGGPLTAMLGSRGALGASGAATVVLGLVACAALAGGRRRAAEAAPVETRQLERA